jgi:hypothetical protein
MAEIEDEDEYEFEDELPLKDFATPRGFKTSKALNGLVVYLAKGEAS